MAVQIPQLKTIGAVAPESQSRANFQAPDYSRAAAIDQRTVSGVLNSAQQFAEKMESQAIEEKSTEAQKLMAMKMNSDLAGVKDYAGDPTQKFAEMRQEWAKYKDDLIAQKYGDMSSISQNRLKQNLDKTMSHYEIQSSLEESRHYNAWKDQNLQDFTKLTGDSLLSLTQLFEPNQKDPNTGETLPLKDTEGKVRLGSDGKPLYVDPDALDKFNGVMNDNLNKISADLRSKGLIHPGPNGETIIDPSAKLTIKKVVDANVAPAIKALTKDPGKNEVVNTLMKEWGGLMSEKAKADIFKTAKTNEQDHLANVALDSVMKKSSDPMTQKALIDQIQDPDLRSKVEEKHKARVAYTKSIEDYSMAKADRDAMNFALSQMEITYDANGVALPPKASDITQLKQTDRYKVLQDNMSPKGKMAVEALFGKRPKVSDSKQLNDLYSKLQDGSFYQMDYADFAKDYFAISKTDFDAYGRILRDAAKNPEKKGMLSHMSNFLETEMISRKLLKPKQFGIRTSNQQKILNDAYFALSQSAPSFPAGWKTSDQDKWVRDHVDELVKGTIFTSEKKPTISVSATPPPVETASTTAPAQKQMTYQDFKSKYSDSQQRADMLRTWETKSGKGIFDPKKYTFEQLTDFYEKNK